MKFLNKKDLANNKIEKVADPTSATDGANKGYVDGKITNLQATLDTIETSKQDKLVAGDNITIDENNVISASGGDVSIWRYE